jgi:hypothetical protein
MTFTLSQEQYEALIALARLGASTPEKQRALDAFLKSVEKANSVTRYALLIQWQEMDQPLPSSVEFPKTWPPEQRFFLENLTRPIAKVDVGRVLAAKARKPTNVLVTPDPAGLVGWTPIDNFFVT